jgi:hypothetical protein
MRTKPLVRIVHNATVTFLVASFFFTMAAVLAHNTTFRPWADSLAGAALWTGVLTAAGYALLAALLVGYGVARLIASRRREQP